MAPPMRRNSLAAFRLKVIVVLCRIFVVVALFFRTLRHGAPKHKNKMRILIPSREAGRYIIADLYLPSEGSLAEKAGLTTKHGSPIPVILNWHGSGFVIDQFGFDELFCGYIANRTGLPVIDADYRKAPECPFPAAIEDVEDVIRWAVAQPQYDAQRIALSGFSAGANLALVAASPLLAHLKRTIPTPFDFKTIIAFYPPVDLYTLPEAKRMPGELYPIPPEVAQVFDEAYVTDCEFDRTKLKNPLISPFYADTEPFPDTVLFVTSEGDSLSAEGTAMAEKLKEGGKRKVIHVEMKGVGHSFDKYYGPMEDLRRDESYKLAAEVLQEVFAEKEEKIR